VDVEEPVSHLQWETILVRKIKAGTLKKLVHNLVSEKDFLFEDMDPGFLMGFLSTYRAFAEVQDVMELLLERSVA
jgi:Na+-transporting NADH:ubiquinone oxidoreductase subunit NqrE